MIRCSCDLCKTVVDKPEELHALTGEWVALFPDIDHICDQCQQIVNIRLEELDRRLAEYREARRREAVAAFVSERWRCREDDGTSDDRHAEQDRAGDDDGSTAVEVHAAEGLERDRPDNRW